MDGHVLWKPVPLSSNNILKLNSRAVVLETFQRAFKKSSLISVLTSSLESPPWCSASVIDSALKPEFCQVRY